MNAAPLIFCERTGNWAAAWRLAWQRAGIHFCEAPADLRCIETRSPVECLERLTDWPAAFVILELTSAACDQTLDLLADIGVRFRPARLAVVCERPMIDYEWLARELGAVHVLASPRELPALCRMVARYAARLPEPSLDWEERIWASLPWAGQ